MEVTIMKRRGSRHSDLCRATRELLMLYGCYAFNVKQMATPRRNRQGEMVYCRGQMQPGVADVCGCTAHGRFLAAEIKVRDKRGKIDVLSDAQLRFKAEVEKRGGLFYEVKETTQALLDGHARGEI